MGIREEYAVLQAENIQLKNEMGSLRTTHEDENQTFKTTNETAFQAIRGELETAEERVEELQDQLDDRELKKFAQAFADQETQYRSDGKTWFKYTLGVFVGCILGTGYLLNLAHGQLWYERIGYYLLDIIAFTSLVFSLKQYSYYIKLSTNYGNRKTLAQSYHNILNSIEDITIKTKFLDVASTTLAATVDIKEEANTIPEKFLDVVKSLIDKVPNR